ncbi:MAG: 2-iminoacetate synthase ThiH [Muribaculaceae bacterium]|nr:2-iminoacetate synthase ThiH [Muribaculaceae bacterium]
MRQINDTVTGEGFADVLSTLDWDATADRVAATGETDVRRVLAKAAAGRQLNTSDFMVLVSEAAEPYLEQMARLARHFTLERFGRTISMYIPMYVSNACTNKCVYCGFNHDNPMQRTILTLEQVRAECEAIKKLGPFENLLIVSGEYPALCGVGYFCDVLGVCRPYFHNLTMEVQPMRQKEYEQLIEAGLNGVVCFQETYREDAYRECHPRGMKSIFRWRLNGYDRMGRAGLHKIGMGVLLGLQPDWRTDAVMMATHLRYLQRLYWRTRYSINFPRLCPSESGFQPRTVVTDRQLAQLTMAFRLFDHDVDISYSTRESDSFRRNMMPLGVTSMSAGSRTEPGGYASIPDALEQFAITDSRSPEAVAADIRAGGYEPVWKDWDSIFD